MQTVCIARLWAPSVLADSSEYLGRQAGRQAGRSVQQAAASSFLTLSVHRIVNAVPAARSSSLGSLACSARAVLKK